MNDPSLYFYNHYEYDLVYSGFNVMYLLKFLVAQKKKKASDSNTKATTKPFNPMMTLESIGTQFTGVLE